MFALLSAGDAAALGSLFTAAGVVVVAFWSRQGRNTGREAAEVGREVRAQLQTNGHSPPMDEGVSVADELFRQISSLGTKIDDLATATLKRFDGVDDRMTGHERRHVVELEVNTLARQGRLERRRSELGPRDGEGGAVKDPPSKEPSP